MPSVDELISMCEEREVELVKKELEWKSWADGYERQGDTLRAGIFMLPVVNAQETHALWQTFHLFLLTMKNQVLEKGVQSLHDKLEGRPDMDALLASMAALATRQNRLEEALRTHRDEFDWGGKHPTHTPEKEKRRWHW
jgi:hypothetical protein